MVNTGHKLGKLGLAILENFVASKLGEKFITELRAPADEYIAITEAMQATADRLWEQWANERLWNAIFNDLPNNNELLIALKQSVKIFYEHPTNTHFGGVLESILKDRGGYTEEKIQKTVKEYITVLTEELALTDEPFRENMRGLSDLRMVKILQNVEQLLAVQQRSVDQAPYNNGAPQFAMSKHIINFDTLINEKTKGFVGRQFVFDALDTFLSEENCGYFVIRGEPGIGKTALMGQLVKTRKLIHHFNVIQQNIRLPELFLANMCAQLIARYKLNLAIPDEPMGSSILLEQCLQAASANLANRPLILAVDALDEAEWRLLPPRVNVHFLPPVLPEGVYMIVSTRPDKDIPLQVEKRCDLDIEPDLEGNLLDIRAYLENYAKRSEILVRLNEWAIDAATFVTELLQKSQGNFMYLRYVLPAIEAGKLGRGGIGELPKGLEAYYQGHWVQMKVEVGGTFAETHERVICILAVMTEPVSLDEVADWTKISHRDVRLIVQAWEPFLLESVSNDERLYRLYHASFADFLAKQVDLRDFSELVATAIEAKIERARDGQ